MISRRKISDSKELQILTAAIHSEGFLLHLISLYQPGLFVDEKIDLILSWCFAYFEKYDKAPKGHIWDLFLQEMDSGKMRDSISELIEKILVKVDKILEQGFNEAFVKDLCSDFFRGKALGNLTDKISEAVDGGEEEEALKHLEEFSLPCKEKAYVEPFLDPELIREAFEFKSVPLFSFKGALGELVNPFLTRDSFLSFMGPEKRGKTWWLFEFAIRALFARRKVAFFQVGDMSEDQGIRRMFTRLAGKPSREMDCGEILIPVLDCKSNQDGSCPSTHRKNEITLLDSEGEKPSWESRPKRYKPCTRCENRGIKFPGASWFKKVQYKDVLDWRGSVTLSEKFQSRIKGGNFRLSTHSNGSISVSDISRIVKGWKKEGWIPDVIAIDYADILAPEKSHKDPRYQENEKWKALRRLSQDYSCLVLTATQSATSSYDSDDLKLGDFSEDKRKYSHVTGMLALNQNKEEKQEGIMRLGWLVLREGGFAAYRQVACLQSLVCGRPYLDGYWVNR